MRVRAGRILARPFSTEAAIVRQGYGDVDAVFRGGAHAVVELELAIGRHSGVPLETRGAIGRYDAARDILELHGAAKVPHRNQELLSRMLGIRRAAIHVHEGHVGGGFGIRGELYPEDVLVCVAAKKFKPAGQMDRGPPRASDRGQSFAPAAHKIRAAVDETASSSPSTTSISTTRAPMCAPTPRASCT
jgi:carbon-monoxide dehydrogenase large subunit